MYAKIYFSCSHQYFSFTHLNFFFGLLPLGPVFDVGSVHVGFVADSVSVGQRGCSHCAFIIHLKYVLILSSHLRLNLSNDLFPTGFCTKNQYAFFFSPLRAVFTTHVTSDLIIRIIFCVVYKSWTTSLYNINTKLQEIGWEGVEWSNFLGIVANGGLLWIR